MARAKPKTAERSKPPITLLYIRRDADELPELDAGLNTIVERYAPMVELRPIEPADVDPQFAGWAERTPTVLVLRRGQVVGEAIGRSLPVRELDRVVGCAVEWAR